jgi:hypothetical protein
MKEERLAKGDLVEIRSWRNKESQLGVVVRPIRDSIARGFSRYEILIGDDLVSVRRDMIEKIERSVFSIQD